MRRLGSSVLVLAGLVGAGCERETANKPPVARAGDDEIVFRGDSISLDGSGSFDPDDPAGTRPLAYAWRLLSGPTAVADGSAETMNFVAGGVGAYVFELAVTDEDDGVATDIVVVEAANVLGVTGIVPADGATGVASRQPAVVFFDAPIRPWTASGSVRVDDVTDPGNPDPVEGNVTLEDDGTAVVFSPVVDWSDLASYRITVTTGAMGLDGAPLRAEVTADFTGAAIDTVAPAVVTASPGPEGATGVSRSAFVEIVFSEPVDETTLLAAFGLDDGVAPVDGVITLGAGGTRALFVPADTSGQPDPVPLAASTDYVVTVLDTLLDANGNALDGDASGAAGGDFTRAFQTTAAADTTGPAVLSISPLRGAQGVSVKLPVVVTFSEPVEPSSLGAALTLTSSGAASFAPLDPVMSRGNTVAVFQPPTNLKTGTVYQVGLGSTVTDLFGNAIAASFDSYFTTGDAPPPDVVQVLPGEGPVDSTLSVQVQGEDFVDGATVFVPGGGVLVNQTTFLSETLLQADLTISPNAQIGSRPITVTNPDGQQATGLALFDILDRPPTITTLSPPAANQGDVAEPISVLGANFQNGATVAISGAGVTVDSVTFVNAGQLDLTVSVAGGASTGARSVTVTNPDGQQAVAATGFTVRFPAPTVSNISQGGGGQGESLFSVVITGTNFLTSPQLPTVNLGTGVLAATVTANATTVTVNVTISGSATLGAHDVVVTNPDGQQGTLPAAFTVLAAPPTVVSSTPAVSQATTQAVTVSGTGFQCTGSGPQLQVRRAGVASTGVSVDNTTLLSCNATSFSRNVTVLGTAAVGLHDLRVTNPDAQFRDGANTFQVREELPQISSLSVSQGRRKATLGVNVNGSFFQSAPTAPVVSFGPGIAVSVDSVTATQIQTTINITDSAALTTRNVVVTNADGQSASFNGFTVQKAPADLVSLSPPAGSQGTTFNVTLTGDDFDCAASPGTVPGVGFGTNVTVNTVTCPGTGVSENSLTANVTLNAGAGVGLHDVTVTNPDGSSDTLSGSFTVREEAPTLAGTPLTPASSGRRKQTLALVVNGAFFQANPTVSFGSDIAVSVGAVTPATIAVTVNIADTAALGVRNVVVTNADGQSVTGTNVFTVNKAAPDLVSLGTTAGSQGTTFNVVLNGDDFDCTLSPGTVPGVSFGTNVTVNTVTCPGTGVSENSLTANVTLNAGAGVGLHDVTVTNPDGAADTLTGSFTVREEAPTLAGTPLSVTSGRRKQSVALTINGTFFQANPTVSFGSNIGVSVGTVTPTAIDVTLSIADAAALGARNVTVTNVDGQSVTGTNIFTVNKAAPDLVSLGTTAGSQGTTFNVVLNGDDFDCTASPVTVPGVGFGTNVTVNTVTCPGTGVSENTLTANVTLNAGAGVGLHDVTVTNPDGAADTLTGSFTVREEVPTLAGSPLTPVSSGRRKQTVALTINGTFFQANPTVSFGSNIAVSVGTVTATTIDVTLSIADTATLGARNVVVTNADGQSVTGTNAFTVNKAAPDLVSLAPSAGSQGTTFNVTLTGDDFDCTLSPGTKPVPDFGTNVTVNTTTCPGTGVSENTLTVNVTLNAGAGVGAHDVVVTNPDGATDTLTGSFTVREEAPTLSGTPLTVTSGRRKQTLALTVNGTFFQASPTVSFGSDIAVSVGAVTPTTIAVTINIADAAALGARNVVVTNVDGQSVTGTNIFTVNKAAPDLVSLAPSAGSQGTTFNVTLTGDDFDCTLSPGTKPVPDFGTNVTVNTTTCPGTGVSENTLTVNVTLNAGAGVGTHDVIVTNPDGAADTLTGSFTVREEAPTLAGTPLSVTSGRRKQTLALTISGTFFQANPVVSFGSNIAVSVGTVTATTIDVTLSIADPAALGARNVTVTNADGQSVTGTNVFTVNKALPDVTSVSPNVGSQGTAFSVTATGDDFDCTASPGTVPGVSLGTNVSVSAITCPGTGVSENSLTFTATLNAGAGVGLHDITVTNPDGGADTLLGAFTVREEAPTVTALQDSTGAALPLISRKSTYSNARVIGTFFQSGATVSLGSNVVVSSVLFVSATRIDVSFTVQNAAPLGDVTITVTNPDAQVGTNTTAVDVRLPVPTITTVLPVEGNEGNAALAVAITGDDFQCTLPPTVSFGAGIGVSVNGGTCTATHLDVTLNISSSAGAGLRNVQVTNTDGQSATAIGFFEVLLEKPVVTSAIVQATGLSSARRNTSVTVRITGDFFQSTPSVPTVTFGSGVAALAAVTFVNAQTLDVDVSVSGDPAVAALGLRNVTVTNADTQATTLTNGFTILRAIPTISNIAPNAGSQQQAPFGVTITGDHFDCSLGAGNEPQVTLGANIAVTSESCGASTSQRATSLTATVNIAAAATVGLHNVDVLNGGDTASGSGTNLFTVREERPVVTSVAPTIRQGETLTMTLTGDFFQATPTSITTPAGSVSNIVWVNAQTVTFTLAVAYSPTLSGNYDLSITNPDGQSQTGTGVVTVLDAAAPTISSVCNPTSDCSPAWVDQGAADRILTINGANFQPSVSVAFSPSTDISDVTILSITPSTIDVRIDVGATAALGARTVTVTNLSSSPNQNSGGTGTGAITITQVAPTVSTINPTSGQQNQKLQGGDGAGGAPGVTITGANFRGPVTVDFLLSGSVDTNLVVTNVGNAAGTVAFELDIGPGAVAGARTVRVTNADGSEGTLTPFTVDPGAGSPVVSLVVKQPLRGFTQTAPATTCLAPNPCTLLDDTTSSIRQDPTGRLFHLFGSSFSTTQPPTVSVSGTGVTTGTVTVNPAGTRLDVTFTAPCGDIATGFRDIIVQNALPPNGNGFTGVCANCLLVRNGVVINEIATNDRSDHGFGGTQEVIELYNGSNCDVNLTDWRLDILEPGTGPTNSSIYEIGSRLPTVDENFSLLPAGNSRTAFKPGGYIMIDRPFDSGGDTLDDDAYITLYSKSGRFIDDVEIGGLTAATDVENDGINDGAPSATDNGDATAASDEMVGRCPNGNDTENDILDWFQEELGGGGDVDGMSATNIATNNTQCAAECSDGTDNDGDGWIDNLDGGCTPGGIFDPIDDAEGGEAATDCNNADADSGDPDALADEDDPECLSGSDNDEANL